MPLIKPIRATFRPLELPSSCRLYAPLLEGSGNSTLSARGVSGNFIGTPRWSTGPWGAELTLPQGTPSAVNFGSYVAQPEVSIVALVRVADLSVPRTLVAKRNATNGWQFYRASNNNLAFRAAGGILVSSLPIALAQYQVVGASVSPVATTFFSLGSNGYAEHSIVATQTIAPGNENLILGAFEMGGNLTNEWNGSFVAVLVADAALGGSQMSRVMHDFWTGRFQAIRPRYSRWLLNASLPVPPPPPPVTPVRAVPVKWYPGLSPRGR